MKRFFRWLSWVVVSGLVLCGCAAADFDSSAAHEDLASGVFGPVVLAEFPQGFQIHSVDGDTAILLAVQPSDAPAAERGVHISRRVDGHVLPDAAAPPEGWATPLSVIVQDSVRHPIAGSDGHFLILDAGVTPANVGMAPARLYRYSYRYRPSTGLTTTLLETHHLPLNMQPSGSFPDGIVYPGGPTILPDGRVVVADSLVGSLWMSDTHLENWQMVLLDPRFGAAPGLPVTGVGLDASGHISPYTYAAPPFPGLPPGYGLYPGTHDVTYAALTDEVCFIVTASPGGIYCLPRATLADTATPPFAKSASIRTVVPPTPGVSDLTDGITYNRYDASSRWLYWQRAPADTIGGGCNALRRVDIRTGAIELLACDNHVFSWANEIAVIPPLLPGSCAVNVLSSVGQQYNNPDVNFAITSPSYFAPSPIALTVIY